MNWDNLVHKKIKAPFVPKLTSDVDTHNFAGEFTNCMADSLEDK